MAVFVVPLTRSTSLEGDTHPPAQVSTHVPAPCPSVSQDMAPIVYTPTVGWVAVNHHRLYRRPRGMYFSAKDRGEMVGGQAMGGQAGRGGSSVMMQREGNAPAGGALLAWHACTVWWEGGRAFGGRGEGVWWARGWC